MCAADFIGNTAQSVKGFRRRTILLSGFKRYGIDYNVIVYMVFVCVCPYHNLIVICETSFDKLDPDVMRLCRCHFTRLERLNEVIPQHIAFLADELFRFGHVLIRAVTVTVKCVCQRIGQTVQVWKIQLRGFFRVNGILQTIV